MTDGVLDAWGEATDMVALALTDTKVYFEWPGTIDVHLSDTLMLMFGSVNETIDGNVNVLTGDMWDYADSPDCLLTETPSDETRPHVIAATILDAVQRFKQRERAKYA